MKIIIIEIVIILNRFVGVVIYILKLFKKDGCLELKFFKFGIIIFFFGSLFYFKFIYLLNKVVDRRIKEFLFLRNLLFEREVILVRSKYNFMR